MNLPRAWARLPGPGDFLETVLEDLTDRVSVLAGVPDDTVCDTLAVEIADLVTHRGIGKWEVVRSREVRTRGPEDSIKRRFGQRSANRSILWIDATGGGRAAAAWTDYARDVAEVRNVPVLCIAMDATVAAGCDEDKRLRRRQWRDFVTPLDSRAIVERVGRRSGHRRANIALKSVLVAELAGMDLRLAEELSRCRLEPMLVSDKHPRERVWAAQIAVLFPIVERHRQRMLKSHGTLWRVPYLRKDETVVRRMQDLEIRDMERQARANGMIGVDRRRLNWLRRVRNQLAHNEVVPWATLTSPTGVDIADFRD